MMIDFIGYIASVMVVFSLLMRDIFMLRIINTAAAFWFIIYGCLINSYPIIITNLAIIFINLYHIYHGFRKD